jgi:hypothetical protein
MIMLFVGVAALNKDIMREACLNRKDVLIRNEAWKEGRRIAAHWYHVGSAARFIKE